MKFGMYAVDNVRYCSIYGGGKIFQLLVGDWVAKAYKPVLDAKITYTMQLVLAYGMI
jgi:hypothetical protein